MSTEKDYQDDFQQIDPEDFLDYDDRYLEKGGGGGKSPGSGKGKKTLKAIKSRAKQASAAGRKKLLEDRLRKSMQAISNRDDELVASYLLWVNENLRSEFSLEPDQIEISYARSGGPGGQNVNKRETKVIMTHSLTGLQVTSDQTRSQLKNKELALELMRERLLAHLLDWVNYLEPNTVIDQEMIRYLLEQ